MANNHPDKVPVANNQGGLMFSNTPEVIVTKTKFTATTIRPSHPIHLGITDVRRIAILQRSTPMKKKSTYTTTMTSQPVWRRASVIPGTSS